MNLSKGEIQELFDSIQSDAFPEVQSKLCYYNKKFTGWSSPYTGNISFNYELLNQRITLDAVKGVIAHELAHQITYQQESFFKKWFVMLTYRFISSSRTFAEHDADRITIDRGYGKELLANRIETTERITDDKLLALYTRHYMSAKEIRARL